MRLRTGVVCTAVIALVATACGGRTHHRVAALPPTVPDIVVGHPTSTTAPTTTAPPSTAAPTTAPPIRVRTAGLALTPFPSCGAYLQSVRAEAQSEVTPYGLSYPYSYGSGPGVMTPMLAAPSASGTGSANGTASSGGSPQSVVGTNDQEVGVDEPDLAKTDGHLLVGLSQGYPQNLEVVDVSQATPALVGTAAVPGGGASRELLLDGPLAVVLDQGAEQGPVPGPRPMNTAPTAGAAGGAAVASPAVSPAPPAPAPPSPPSTDVLVYDLSSRTHPVLARTYQIQGYEVAARLIGGRVVIVVGNQPEIAFPTRTSGETDAQALAANRAAVAQAPLADWLPTVRDATGVTRQASCAQVQHTGVATGVSSISVLTIDPTLPTPGPETTALGNPGVVYVSAANVYVATAPFAEQEMVVRGAAPPGESSIIHDFDISGTAPRYLGSGAVPGVPLNQYALSEDGGVLRVATTTGIPEPPPNEGAPVPAGDGSQSLVTTLEAAGGALVQLGQLGGLGVGERIYGVRFVGPLGFVVTYRQLDPLYVVDLTRPANPRLRGALQQTGYSAYLHPVGPGLLLGIGASADANARRTGAQVALFDVADPDHPATINRVSVPDGWAGVENDPHAFTWDAPASLAVVPLYADNFDGAIVYRIDAAHGVVEAGRLSHGTDQIQRTFVVGGRFFSLAGNGVLVSSATSFQPAGWIAFR